VRRPILLTTAVFLLLLVGASPVMAHSDTGLLVLEATGSAGPPGVQVRARLVYANDRDPVSSATVTVEATGPNGTAVPPRPLESEGNGVYTAVLALPVAGSWTLRATSLAPEASAEVRFEAAAAPATTTTTNSTTTTAPPRATGPVRASASVDDDGRGGWFLAAGAITLIGVLIAASAWWWTHRRAAAR
jgi:hypothetical protein